jgi:hypothetical protein
MALRRNRRKPPIRIENSKLPHRPHTRESYCHSSDSYKFAQIAVFLGTLKNAAFTVKSLCSAIASYLDQISRS